MKSIRGKVLTCITLLFVCNCSVLAQQPELVVQTGHANTILSVAFSPDGKFIASGSWDQTIKLWDTATGKQLRSLEGHSSFTSSVAFSPDGKVIATGSGDSTIKLWDTATGKQLYSLEGHADMVLAVAFSPDSKVIASGGGDKTIKLWDTATGKQFRSLAGHAGEVKSVAFSPDGKVIATGSGDKTIKIWDLATGKQLRSFEGHPDEISSVAFSPDGKMIVSSYALTFAKPPKYLTSGDRTIKLWDASSGKQLRSFEGHTDLVTSVAFSPDGKVIASGSYDKTIKLWDTATGKQLRSLSGDAGLVESVTFSSDGKVIATGGGDSTIKLWDTATGKQLHSLEAHAAWVDSVTFSPDGKVIATGGVDSTIKLWDTATSNQLRSLEGHAIFSSSVAFSPDGKVIASGSDDKTIKLWDAETSVQLRSLAGHTDRISAVAFSRDGKLIVSGSDDKTIRLWDAASGYLLRSFENHAGRVTSVAFSPDGKVIASGSADKTVKLWDVATGNRLHSLEGQAGFDGRVNSVAFSPDGKVIASGSYDNTIKLWDLASGKQLRSLEGHVDGVNSVAFSPDGKVIASGSEGKTIRLWDAATGKHLRSLAGHLGGVHSVQFSPDGKVIASGSYDKTIKLWDAATGNQLRSLAGHLNDVDSVAFSPDGKTIVSGSSDATMKLWRTNSDKPVATLISLDKNDWVVVTPDGRFDGSPDGMKLIHYVQDNQPIPLDSFFEQFYTPKLLARVLSGESASISRPTVDFSKSIRVPPLVKITSPRAGESFSTDEIHISVEATDQGGGVDEIRLYQNGKLVSDDTRQLVRTKANNKTYDVTLLPGVNTFRATAFNRDRTESNPAEIKIELRAAEAASDLYILAIGLNEYKNTRYNLNYGRADAQAFADAVEQRGRNIFRRIKKEVILDDQATRQGVQEAFNRIIAEAKPQDAFVFYFAGHGVMSEGSDNTPAEFYLVPYDVVRLYGDDSGLATNGVAARLLKDLCTKVRAQKQLIVLDACESAGVLETFARRGAPEEKAILQLARSAGIVVLAATGQDQVATEFNKLGHGVFTYALLQAMRGDADAGSPPDGKITVIEIVAYINDRVPELTKQYRGKTQYPNAYARGQDFPLGVK